MDTVLTHVGEELPPYVRECVRQFRLFNPDSRVFLVTDRMNFACADWANELGVTLVPAEEYRDDRVRLIRRSGGLEVAKRWVKRRLLGRKDSEFWINTTTRLIYLENFASRNGLGEFCHFENDVMVYFGTDDYAHVFRKFADIAITPGSESQVMTGFAYFKSWNSLRKLNDYIVTSYRDDRLDEIKEKYGVPVMSEMMLMRAFADDTSSMGFLPILPEGPHSGLVGEFEAVFDPASYGQFVGGTFAGDAPGFIDSRHYIGKWLETKPERRVSWRIEGGLRVPYLEYGDGKSVRINNLHVHSKNLSLFASDGVTHDDK